MRTLAISRNSIHLYRITNPSPMWDFKWYVMPSICSVSLPQKQPIFRNLYNMLIFHPSYNHSDLNNWGVTLIVTPYKQQS